LRIAIADFCGGVASAYIVSVCGFGCRFVVAVDVEEEEEEEEGRRGRGRVNGWDVVGREERFRDSARILCVICVCVLLVQRGEGERRGKSERQNKQPSPKRWRRSDQPKELGVHINTHNTTKK